MYVTSVYIGTAAIQISERWNLNPLNGYVVRVIIVSISGVYDK